MHRTARTFRIQSSKLCRVAAPCIAAVFVYACDRQPEGHTASQSDVSTTATGWSDTASLQETQILMESPPLSRAGAIAFVPGSGLLLYDAADGTLYLHDGNDSAAARPIARRGRGPGEFGTIGSLAPLAGGGFAARDLGRLELVLLSGSGTEVRRNSIPPGETFGQKGLRVTAGDTIYLGFTRRPSDRGQRPWMVWIRDGSATRPADSVSTFSLGTEECPLVRLSSPGFAIVSQNPAPVWALTRQRTLVGGCAARYELQLVRNGEQIAVAERDAPTVQRTAEERAGIRAQFTEVMQRQFQGWTWTGPDIPSAHPAFREILVADDGRLWVVTPRASLRCRKDDRCRWLDRSGFDVWTENLEYLGAVNVPEGFQFAPEPAIRGDTVFAVVTDSLGVPRVSRFTLHK